MNVPATTTESIGTSRRAAVVAVAFAIVFPSVITWLYFVALAGHSRSLQQGSYAVGKCLQFGFPAFWVLWVLGLPVKWPRIAGRGLVSGTLFGVVVAGTGYATYVLYLQPAGILVAAQSAVEVKMAGLGIRSVWQYVALSVFYSVFHSLLEEYYWRWFVFGQLRRLTGLRLSVFVSAIGFAAHHVIVLAQFFGWHSPATYVFSMAVGIGGAVWALLYEHSRSILAPWISHLLIDAGIFLIGFQLIRASLI